jgi:hypothetical protein
MKSAEVHDELDWVIAAALELRHEVASHIVAYDVNVKLAMVSISMVMVPDVIMMRSVAVVVMPAVVVMTSPIAVITAIPADCLVGGGTKIKFPVVSHADGARRRFKRY